MAKPNYQFEKRQRDLAKKSKQEEKRRLKRENSAGAAEGGQPDSENPADAAKASGDATVSLSDNAAMPASSPVE